MLKDEKEELYEYGLPKYLEDDLMMVKTYSWNDSLFDCYLDELYGSINSAYTDDRISKDCADYLRNKYFFGNLK